MAARRVVFYKTQRGYCPVKEFLDSLSGKEAQRLAWLLTLVEEIDRIPENHFKKLRGTDGIWEGRIQLGVRTFRLLGFFYSNATFVVTNGFAKKSQKTPRREIQTAERYKQDYYERQNSDG
jgi:phage-related protein